MTDDADKTRTDIAKPNRFSQQFKQLNLTKGNYIFLGTILSVTLFFVFMVLGDHLPSSSSTLSKKTVGPVATEVIETASASASALSSDVDDDVLEINTQANARLQAEIENNKAESGAGTRITTTVLSDDDGDDSGVSANLSGLEEISAYEPSLDKDVASTFFQNDLDLTPRDDFVPKSRSPSPRTDRYQDQSGSDEDKTKAMEAALKLISRIPDPQIYTRNKVEEKDQPLPASAAMSNTQASVDPQKGISPDEKFPLIKVATGLYTRAYAVNIHALNSDISGDAILEIISEGPLRGARLSATYERVEWTELVRLRVTSMALKSGQRVAVNAIVLDSVTSLAAISGEVDNHYLYRYGWWGIGSTLASLGAGVEAYAQTTTVTNGGGSITASTDLNTTEKALLTFGTLGSDVGGVMKKNIDRPPTVTLDAYQELGVFFLEDVLIIKES